MPAELPQPLSVGKIGIAYSLRIQVDIIDPIANAPGHAAASEGGLACRSVQHDFGGGADGKPRQAYRKGVAEPRHKQALHPVKVIARVRPAERCRAGLPPFHAAVKYVIVVGISEPVIVAKQLQTDVVAVGQRIAAGYVPVVEIISVWSVSLLRSNDE